jgi:hypothetical protein
MSPGSGTTLPRSAEVSAESSLPAEPYVDGAAGFLAGELLSLADARAGEGRLTLPELGAGGRWRRFWSFRCVSRTCLPAPEVEPQRTPTEPEEPDRPKPIEPEEPDIPDR